MNAKQDYLSHPDKLCVRAIGGIIADLQLTRQDVFRFKCEVLPYQALNSFMRLDKAAFSALHILPTEKKASKTPTSLLGYLNKCRSALGTRKLETWLRQPLVDYDRISSRHDAVEWLCDDDNQMELSKIIQTMKHVPDLHSLITKLNKTQVTPVNKAASGT